MVKKLLHLVENLIFGAVCLVVLILAYVGMRDTSLLVFGALFLCIGLALGIKLGRVLKKRD